MSNIYVIKRDGKKANFEKEKISNAIKKTMTQTGDLDQKLIHKVVSKIEQSLEKNNQKEIEIEKIQDMVEEILMKSNRADVAREYIRYRYKKNEERFHKNKLFVFGSQIIDGSNQEIIKENANLNGESFSGKMNKFGAEYSKSFSKEFIIPDKIKKAIDEGWIYIHDLDHYALGTHNCIFVPFDKLLKNGFQVSDKGSVRTPNSISTAMAQVAIIFQCQQNSQYGGLGASKFDWDLAPYVNKSFKKHFKKGQKYFDECKNIEEGAIHFESASLKKGCPRTYAYAHEETVTEVYQSAESLIHNLNTMASRAGGLSA